MRLVWLGAQVTRGLALEAALVQAPRNPRPLGDQVLLLLAASNGFLDPFVRDSSVAVDDKSHLTAVSACEGLIVHVREHAPELLDAISLTRNMNSAAKEQLVAIIKEHLSNHIR